VACLSGQAHGSSFDFADYRRDRAFHAWKQAMWAKGLKLSTQAADGRAQCFCGAAIGLNDRTRRFHRAHGVRDGMKFAEPRPFADPEVAARKLVEIAGSGLCLSGDCR